MCTAITYSNKDHYFGRNLDYERPYRTSVTVTPRNYAVTLRNGERLESHYAMIGMAFIADNYPLYFDATNEKGLSIAGLNFPGNAYYFPPSVNKHNIAPFELPLWLLGTCQNIREAEDSLSCINLTDESYSKKLPLTPLHWIVSDREGALVIESTKAGLNVFRNPIGILTNNPPFEYHMQNLTNYINITSAEPHNRFSQELELKPHSRGMGGIGLPGDLSSSSRFVRAAFTKWNSVSMETESENISQVFHILGTVAQTRGCASVGNAYEITLYTSCCNSDQGIYYYTTYENNQITAIKMYAEDLDSEALIAYPIRTAQSVLFEN